MDYRMKHFYSFALTACLYSSVHTSCTLENKISGCEYTALCDGYPGPFNNPGCSGTLNVTMILSNANTNNLNTGFFSNTNFDSRVRGFIAIDNNLKLIEKFALKYYRYSLFVDMSVNNNIEVIESGAFLELTAMKRLNLSHNYISQLYNDTLKISDTTISPLEVLDLSYNQLTILNSYVFSHFPKLQALYLQNNKINILSDKTFNNLNSLKILMIRNNFVSSINMTLVLLTELIFLDMSHNNINKLVGFEMPRVGSLAYVNISYNNMESIDHATFSLLPQLRKLDISHNKIHSTIEKDMFANNYELNYLNLYENGFTTLSPTAFKFNNLDYLNLDKNNITGDITNDTFKGLQKLTNLNITHQHIIAIKKYGFSEMVTLQYLNLSYNIIKNIDNASFVNVSSISILDISHNKIENLYFLKMFISNLTEMYINNNNLVTIHQKLFENHSNLKKLDISENMIVIIERNALPLNNLQVLGMRSNNISGVATDNVFSPAKLLRNLDLSNFHLTKLNDSALVDIPLVARLNLSHNNLNYIHPNNFKGVENMYSLDISFNNLTNLVINTKLSKLKAIYLDNNKFTKIPNIFGNESILEYLDISHNNISDVSDVALENIRQLKVLHLSYNRINNFNNNYTNALVKLTELDLASNEITVMINMSFFVNLESVNVSYNQISYVNKSQFPNLPLLRLLSLSGNKLMTLEPGTLQNLGPLFLLDLSSNYLTNIRFGTFRGLNNTKIINVSNNKIKSLNVMVFHECPELKTLILDYNFIKTVDVKKISIAAPKLEVLSLGGNPIACEEVIQSKRTSEVSTLRIVVTSLHKVFHEDNVHGIKCGDNANNDTVETTTIKPAEARDAISGVPAVNVLLVWCGVLSFVAVVGLTAFYFYRSHGTRLNFNRDTRVQLRNSANVSQSECYGDLLN